MNKLVEPLRRLYSVVELEVRVQADLATARVIDCRVLPVPQRGNNAAIFSERFLFFVPPLHLDSERAFYNFIYKGEQSL